MITFKWLSTSQKIHLDRYSLKESKEQRDSARRFSIERYVRTSRRGLDFPSIHRFEGSRIGFLEIPKADWLADIVWRWGLICMMNASKSPTLWISAVSCSIYLLPWCVGHCSARWAFICMTKSSMFFAVMVSAIRLGPWLGQLHYVRSHQRPNSVRRAPVPPFIQWDFWWNRRRRKCKGQRIPELYGYSQQFFISFWSYW